MLEPSFQLLDLIGYSDPVMGEGGVKAFPVGFVWTVKRYRRQGCPSPIGRAGSCRRPSSSSGAACWRCSLWRSPRGRPQVPPVHTVSGARHHFVYNFCSYRSKYQIRFLSFLWPVFVGLSSPTSESPPPMPYPPNGSLGEIYVDGQDLIVKEGVGRVTNICFRFEIRYEVHPPPHMSPTIVCLNPP